VDQKATPIGKHLNHVLNKGKVKIQGRGEGPRTVPSDKKKEKQRVGGGRPKKKNKRTVPNRQKKTSHKSKNTLKT